MSSERRARAALYTRVSTKEQAVEGTSLDSQLDRLRAHAEAQGWDVVGVFTDDGVSGDLPVAERPQAARLMDLCGRGGVDVVAVAHLDRFGRDAVETLIAARELQRSRVGLVSVGEGIDTRRESDRFNLEIRSVIAGQEKRRILERTTRGLRARVAAGDWPGGPAPYGFRLAPGPSGRSRLALDESEVAVLRRAAELIVGQGHSTWTAAATLNALGMTPRNGDAWEHGHLRRVLLSPTLGGEWVYRPTRQDWEDADPEPTTLEIPRVLDPQRHAALLDALGRTSTTAGTRDRVYPLTGRITGPCGGPFHGIWRRDRESRFYRCRNARPEAKKRGEGCSCRTLVADQVEGLVWGEVQSILSEPARLLALAEDYLDLSERHSDAAEPETVDDIERRLEKLRQAKTTQVATALKAGIDAETLADAVAEIDAERRTLEAHRDRLVALRERAQAEGDRAARLRGLAVTARTRLGSMDPEERQAVLELLDIRVHVAGWSRCPTCDGKGKLKGGRGGLACPTCHATRQVPTLVASGSVPDGVDAGQLEGEALRDPGPPRR